MAKQNKKRDARLSNLKRKSKETLPSQSSKVKDSQHNATNELANYKQKLTVYENIIQELREKLKEKS